MPGSVATRLVSTILRNGMGGGLGSRPLFLLRQDGLVLALGAEEAEEAPAQPGGVVTDA